MKKKGFRYKIAIILSVFIIIVFIVSTLYYSWGRVTYPFYKIIEVSEIILLKDTIYYCNSLCYLTKNVENKISSYKDTIWMLFDFKTQFFDTTNIERKSPYYDNGDGGMLDNIEDINFSIGKQDLSHNLSGLKIEKYDEFGRSKPKYCQSLYKNVDIGQFQSINEFIKRMNMRDPRLCHIFCGGYHNVIGFYFLKKDIDIVKDTLRLKFEIKFSDGRIIGKEIEIYK